MAEGEQQCNEVKEEILKLWQEKETSPIVRWAGADESPEEESNQGEEKKETRGMRWADCEDDEGKEKEELTSEKPRDLEQREESEHERKKEEERRAQEAREEERRAQEELEQARAQEK